MIKLYINDGGMLSYYGTLTKDEVREQIEHITDLRPYHVRRSLFNQSIYVTISA